MNVPKGYKMTEVGVIPEDWEVCRIGDIANVTRGASPRPIDSPIWFDDSSLVGWVRISDVTRSSKFLEETTQKLSMLGIKQSRFVKQNSLIMSICATVGRPILTKIDVCIHDGFVVFSNLDLEEEYLYYLLLSIEKDWSKNGQIGSQMNLNTELINSTLIPIPKNRREQRSLSRVLSDTDELINALDKLIAKKRDIKKAVMQELLTGKTRLPGFSGKWEVKKLGDLGIFLKGSGVKKNESLSGDLPCIRYGEIYTKYNYYIKEIYSYISHEVASTATKIEKNDILFAGSGETKEEIGKCVAFVHDVESYAGGDIIILRPYKPYKIDSIFLGYYLNSAPISKQKSSKGQGDAVVHISTKALSMIEVKIPSVDEQQAIAQVLSDMDREITALEQRRDKTKALKQGMMQELLTGRIRLPKEDTNDSI